MEASIKTFCRAKVQLLRYISTEGLDIYERREVVSRLLLFTSNKKLSINQRVIANVMIMIYSVRDLDLACTLAERFKPIERIIDLIGFYYDISKNYSDYHLTSNDVKDIGKVIEKIDIYSAEECRVTHILDLVLEEISSYKDSFLFFEDVISIDELLFQSEEGLNFIDNLCDIIEYSKTKKIDNLSIKQLLNNSAKLYITGE